MPIVPVPQIIFYCTSVLLIVSAVLVIVSRHAVQAALFFSARFFL